MMNGLGEPRAIEALLAGIVKDHGVRALHHPADMTKPAEIFEMVKTAEQEFGALDILVNNAATNPAMGPMVDLEPRAVRKIG